MRKPELVKSTSAYCGDYQGEGEIQAELYDGDETREVALHVIEPGNPDPITSLYLPAVDAAILAERITAVARAATEEKPSA